MTNEFVCASKFVYHLAVAFFFVVFCFSLFGDWRTTSISRDTCKRMDGIYLGHQEYSSYYAIACMLPDATTVVVSENK